MTIDSGVLAWLDFGASEQRKAIQLLDQLREHDTVDELGLGAIRDAFAERLFPGTSTIQTRARYFLIVPWIYKRLEAKGTSSAEIALKAKAEEVKVIKSLRPLGLNQGVIGIDAGERLKRFPSSVYWYGLGSWGIRRFEGSQRKYHASLDRFNEAIKRHSTARTDDPGFEAMPPNWDCLPPEPAVIETLDLERNEAEYLRDQIQRHASGSLLSVMCGETLDLEALDFPWDYPRAAIRDGILLEDLEHARNFSDVGWAATILYQLLLVRKVTADPGAPPDGTEEKLEQLTDDLEEATEALHDRADVLTDWGSGSFWMRPQFRLMSGASHRARRFLDDWMAIIRETIAGGSLDSEAATALITNREVAMKGNLARVRNVEARRRWIAQGLSAPMDYRWNATVRRLLLDIHAGLGR